MRKINNDKSREKIKAWKKEPIFSENRKNVDYECTEFHIIIDTLDQKQIV